jgi:hypothetical protein
MVPLLARGTEWLCGVIVSFFSEVFTKPCERSGGTQTCIFFPLLSGSGCKCQQSHMFKVSIVFHSLFNFRSINLYSFALMISAPRARSGFLMTVHPSDDAIFVFGGYSKEKITASGGSGSGTKKSEGKIHTDMWMLSLKGVISGGKSGGGGTSRLDLGKISWQKLSNKGAPPSVRCGASMTSYKNKGIYFGGVNDSEGPRHSIVSTFYNDLYAFDFDRKRYDFY